MRWHYNVGVNAWRVGLEGEEDDIERLGEALPGGFRIVRVNARPTLAAEGFADLADAAEVRAKAIADVEVFNRSTFLWDEAARPVSCGSVFRVSESGGVSTWVFPEPARAEIRVYAPRVIADGARPVAHPAMATIEIALADPAKAEALAHFCQGTWASFYKALELVEGKLTRSGIVCRGWASNRDLKLFKQTANSPTALGTEARHGRNHALPPAEPMTLERARELIRGILQAWTKSAT